MDNLSGTSRTLAGQEQVSLESRDDFDKLQQEFQAFDVALKEDLDAAALQVLEPASSSVANPGTPARPTFRASYHSPLPLQRPSEVGDKAKQKLKEAEDLAKRLVGEATRFVQTLSGPFASPVAQTAYESLQDTEPLAQVNFKLTA